jgi:hypothetical protein
MNPLDRTCYCGKRMTGNYGAECEDGHGIGFMRYRRSAVAELCAWAPGYDMTRVSVSAPDKEAGSPKAGDFIARNPANHDDQWLVSAAYFAANFEPA